MIVIVFRSRLNPHMQGDYGPHAERMSVLVQTMPGYISHKGFVAEDGERVTIAEFESDAAVAAWAVHPEHVQAKKRGRENYYAEYQVQVCTVQRMSGSSTKK